MNLGKPLRIVTIPVRVPVQRPTPKPTAAPEPMIPLPADWPTRRPAQLPNVPA